MKEFLLNVAMVVTIAIVAWAILMTFWPTRIVLVGIIRLVLYTYVALCYIVLLLRIVFALQDRFNAYYNRKIYEKKIGKQKGQEEAHQEADEESTEDSHESYQESYTRTEKSPEEDYAEVLGMDAKGLNKESIKSAYRDKMKEYHPDRIESFNLGREFKELAEEKAKRINEAYAFLKRRYSV